MTPIQLRVFGTPAPQGSKRHVGGGRMVEASKKVAPWREAVVSEVIRAGHQDARIDAPVFIDVTFYLARPAGHSNTKGIKASAPFWPAKVPDLDKLVRSTFDALTQSGVITDDSRITKVHARKHYADDTSPGALISINQLTEETE